MIPDIGDYIEFGNNTPRMSGDDPQSRHLFLSWILYSPHERG